MTVFYQNSCNIQVFNEGTTLYLVCTTKGHTARYTVKPKAVGHKDLIFLSKFGQVLLYKMLTTVLLASFSSAFTTPSEIMSEPDFTSFSPEQGSDLIYLDTSDSV